MNIPEPSFDDDWREWAAKVAKFFQNIRLPGELKTGAIVDFRGTVQSGFLLCDGSTFPAGTYPALYQLLGSTTLPNLTSSHGVGYVVGIKT